MRARPLEFSLAAASFLLITAPAHGQSWSDNFDAYTLGDPVDPGGAGSIGNGWESWSNGIGSSTVTDAQARSAPHSLLNEPTADTVANYTSLTPHPANGLWVFNGQVYLPTGFSGQAYWILVNRPGFRPMTYDGNALPGPVFTCHETVLHRSLALALSCPPPRCAPKVQMGR